MFRAVELSLMSGVKAKQPQIDGARDMPEASNTDFNRAMRDAKKQAGGFANEVSDAASQVADSATNAARNTAGSFEKALRNTIENQPYTAAAIALGIGWLLGRTHRPF